MDAPPLIGMVKKASAGEFLERAGRERALEIWREFPILDYGKKWDVD